MNHALSCVSERGHDSLERPFSLHVTELPFNRYSINLVLSSLFLLCIKLFLIFLSSLFRSTQWLPCESYTKFLEVFAVCAALIKLIRVNTFWIVSKSDFVILNLPNQIDGFVVSIPFQVVHSHIPFG